jgi:peptidoglycan hydrolase-like protein with peptidoglycan-binding domain
MALSSRLFGGVRALEACLINDAAHVTLGTSGTHVMLIQRALVLLGDHSIPTAEYVAGVYGPRTAAAVLNYKRGRRIINFSYQDQADNIVGKMTIAALDRDVAAKENLSTLADSLGEDMGQTVILSVNDGPWNKWGEQFVQR